MNKIFYFLSGLIVEKGSDKISLGRASWWLIFIPALYIWVDSLGKQDIADHHLAILLLLATYNFGKKGLEVIKNRKLAKEDGPG